MWSIISSGKNHFRLLLYANHVLEKIFSYCFKCGSVRCKIAKRISCDLESLFGKVKTLKENALKK